MHGLDKYLGIVLVSVVLYYLFKDARGTTAIIGELSRFNTNAIRSLQGEPVANIG